MRRQWELIFLGLLLALTFYLASGYGLTTANFSVIGNQGGRRPAFLLWGALTGNYFYLYTDALMERAGCRDPAARFFLYGALLLLVTAVGLPYLPEQVPGLSRLHVMLSFLAPVSLGLAQLRFLAVLRRERGKLFGASWCIPGTLPAGAVFLLFRIGIVSSLLEVFITLGVCLYLRVLGREIDVN